jgi:arylsulfatase
LINRCSGRHGQRAARRLERKARDKAFKVHIDDYNLLPYPMGKEEKSPQEEFLYFNDDGLLIGVRHKQWSIF